MPFINLEDFVDSCINNVEVLTIGVPYNGEIVNLHNDRGVYYSSAFGYNGECCVVIFPKK